MICVHRIRHDGNQDTGDTAKHICESPPGKVGEIAISYFGNNRADKGDKECELYLLDVFHGCSCQHECLKTYSSNGYSCKRERITNHPAKGKARPAAAIILSAVFHLSDRRGADRVVRHSALSGMSQTL